MVAAPASDPTIIHTLATGSAGSGGIFEPVAKLAAGPRVRAFVCALAALVGLSACSPASPDLVRAPTAALAPVEPDAAPAGAPSVSNAATLPASHAAALACLGAGARWTERGCDASPLSFERMAELGLAGSHGGEGWVSLHRLPMVLPPEPGLTRALRALAREAEIAAGVHGWAGQGVSPPPGGLAVSTRFEQVADTGRLLAVRGATLLANGRERPHWMVHALVYDRAERRVLMPEDLFRNPARAMTAISDAARESLSEALALGALGPDAGALAASAQPSGVRGTPDALRVAYAVDPEDGALDHFVLEPGDESGKVVGLRVVFQPGRLRPTAQGPTEVVVPASVFESYLRPAYADSFEALPPDGGAAPASEPGDARPTA